MTANGTARFGDDWPDVPTPIAQQINQELAYLRDSEPLLEPQETTPRNISDWSYRARFLAGKEKEMDSVIDAYTEIYGTACNAHGQALQDCRKYAKFAREKTSGEVKVFTDSCRDRWCPMCASQKAHYAKDSTKMYLQTLERPKFLTLTLRNNENDLKTQVEFLQDSFRTLRQRAYWKKNVRGGMWYLELKRGQNSEQWHPHLHILLDGNYMEQGELSELWEQVTYGSPILWIVEVSDQERAAEYVSKYSSKPARLEGMPLHDRVEIIEAMFRKRLCGTFGNAKTFTLTPPKVELDGEWQTIGYHDEVVQKAEKDPAAKAILIAYNVGTSLTEEQYEAYTGEPVWVEYVEYIPKKDPQLWLDFYNTS